MAGGAKRTDAKTKIKTKVNTTRTAPVKVVRMTVRDKIGLIADSTTVLGNIVGGVSVLLGVTVGGVGVGGSMVSSPT